MMTPEEELQGLQWAVSEARRMHAALVSERDVLLRARHFASAYAVGVKVQRAFVLLQQAKARLLAHTLKHQP